MIFISVLQGEQNYFSPCYVSYYRNQKTNYPINVSNIPFLMHLIDNFDDIVSVLKNGGSILYPTDTIWGLGCDACNQNAIENIYHIKKRPTNKPMILLVSDIEMLKTYVEDIHPRVETLIGYFDRPLTVIYQNPKNLPPAAISKDNTVAIRVTKDQFCQELIRTWQKPLVSTSANISGENFPQNYDEVDQYIRSQADYIVKYKRHELRKKAASVIVSYNNEGELNFIRS